MKIYDKIPSEHAEVAALRKINDPKGTTVYVVRIKADGSPGISKPCADCREALTKAGVKKVIYSDNTSWTP